MARCQRLAGAALPARRISAPCADGTGRDGEGDGRIRPQSWQARLCGLKAPSFALKGVKGSSRVLAGGGGGGGGGVRAEVCLHLRAGDAVPVRVDALVTWALPLQKLAAGNGPTGRLKCLSPAGRSAAKGVPHLSEVLQSALSADGIDPVNGLNGQASGPVTRRRLQNIRSA